MKNIGFTCLLVACASITACNDGKNEFFIEIKDTAQQPIEEEAACKFYNGLGEEGSP